MPSLGFAGLPSVGEGFIPPSGANTTRIQNRIAGEAEMPPLQSMVL